MAKIIELIVQVNGYVPKIILISCHIDSMIVKNDTLNTHQHKSITTIGTKEFPAPRITPAAAWEKLRKK